MVYRPIENIRKPVASSRQDLSGLYLLSSGGAFSYIGCSKTPKRAQRNQVNRDAERGINSESSGVIWFQNITTAKAVRESAINKLRADGVRVYGINGVAEIEAKPEQVTETIKAVASEHGVEIVTPKSRPSRKLNKYNKVFDKID